MSKGSRKMWANQPTESPTTRRNGTLLLFFEEQKEVALEYTHSTRNSATAKDGALAL